MGRDGVQLTDSDKNFREWLDAGYSEEKVDAFWVYLTDAARDRRVPLIPSELTMDELDGMLGALLYFRGHVRGRV